MQEQDLETGWSEEEAGSGARTPELHRSPPIHTDGINMPHDGP